MLHVKKSPASKCPYRSPMAVSEAIRDIIKDKVVCELGCAEGDNLVFMSRFCKKSFGIDWNTARLEVAQKRGLDAVRGDYQTDRIPDADVYYFWPNYAKDYEFLFNKIASQGKECIVIAASERPYEKDVVKNCAKKYNGELKEVPFNEGDGHRESGAILLAIIYVGKKSLDGVKKRVVLTFDDGYLSHFEFVAPLLREYNFPATFFINGDFCDGRVPDWPGHIEDVEIMSWNDVKQLHQQGFEIGHHLFNHCSICKLSNEDITIQVKKLDNKLRDLGVPEPISFCYPTYHHCIRTMKLLGAINRTRSFEYARSGCEKTSTFSSFGNGGSGSPFNLIWDNPMNINCLGIFGSSYQYDNFAKDLDKIGKDECGVFCFHRFDMKDATSVPKSCLAQVVNKLFESNCNVVSMKDIHA